jgi:hypothetical protein
MKNNQSNSVVHNLIINGISPIYKLDQSNGYKTLLMNFNPLQTREQGILNFTGISYCDRKYHFIEHLCEYNPSINIIVTDSDLLAHDVYLPMVEKFLEAGKSIVFFYTNDVLREGCPSAKRVKKAVEKLRNLGYNVDFCQGLKELKSYFKKEHNIDVTFTDDNGVISLPTRSKKDFPKQEIDALNSIIKPVIQKHHLRLINCSNVA